MLNQTMQTADTTIKNEVKISVVIPVYNVEQHLTACLDSILNQTLKEIEIICVDDCSPDNSASIMREYALRDRRIKNIFLSTNSGLSYARNTAMKQVSGKYLYFIDSDDMLALDALEKLYTLAESNNADQVLFLSKIFSESQNSEMDGYYKDYPEDLIGKSHQGNYLLNHFLKICRFFPSACLQITRTELLRKHNISFIEGYIHEDIYFSSKTMAFAENVIILNDRFYLRRVHKNSVMAQTDIDAIVRHVLGYAAQIGVVQSELQQGVYSASQEKTMLLLCTIVTKLMYNKYIATLDNYHRQILLEKLSSCPGEKHWLFIMPILYSLDTLSDKLNTVEPVKSDSLLKIYNAEIFSGEKQILLQQMMENLMPLWGNTTEPILPFVCRKKSKNILVSVILPVYNVEKFLLRAMQSIVNQTLEDIEIICVNDGSTDRSLEILEFFAAHDERIAVISQPNSNAGAARNHGLKYCTGKFLYIMDSDDWCVPHMLEKAVTTAQYENSDLVAWSFDMVDSNTKKILWAKRFKDGLCDPETVQNLYSYLSPCVWNKIFLRKMIVDNGLRFQEIRNNNDLSFSMCAISLAKRLWTIAEPLYMYRKSGTGLQATLNKDPYCCVKARIHSLKEMERLNLLTPMYHKHFVDAFYHLLGNQLSRMPLSLEQLIEIRSMLREYFDYRSVKIEDVVDKEGYIFMQSIFFSNEEYHPTQLITNLKQKESECVRLKAECVRLKAECVRLKAECVRLKAECVRLKATKEEKGYSESHIAWFLRKLRGGVLCLKEHGVIYTFKLLNRKIINKISS